MKILITGATSGIGFDTGVSLIKKGHFVYFTVHTDDQIKTVVEKLKELDILDNASVFKLDITEEEDRNLIRDLDIDCLVCNGATGYSGSVLDIDISRLEDNFKVNVFSNIELIQTYCAHLFVENQKGRVVVISSLAGKIPIPFLGSYASTKSSLSILTSCLNKELKLINKNIKIKLVEPGIYNTGFNDYMFDNKEESIYFRNIEEDITNISKKIFRIIGKNDTGSIVKKIVKTITTKSNRLIYRSPYFQSTMIKLYNLFH